MRDDERRELVADGLETVSGAIRWTKLSRSMLYELMTNGRLAYVSVGRTRRIPKRALVTLAAESLHVVEPER